MVSDFNACLVCGLAGWKYDDKMYVINRHYVNGRMVVTSVAVDISQITEMPNVMTGDTVRVTGRLMIADGNMIVMADMVQITLPNAEPEPADDVEDADER